MPDFERIIRKLELDSASTPEAKAYARGMHAGMDKARWQVVKVAIITAFVWLLSRWVP